MVFYVASRVLGSTRGLFNTVQSLGARGPFPAGVAGRRSRSSASPPTPGQRTAVNRHSRATHRHSRAEQAECNQHGARPGAALGAAPALALFRPSTMVEGRAVVAKKGLEPKRLRMTYG